jgi:hypothetical protein
LGYENSVYLAQEDHRTRPGVQAVARINVLLNDGTGTQLVVSGPIVSPQNPGDIFSHVYESVDGDWLSCGWIGRIGDRLPDSQCIGGVTAG